MIYIDRDIERAVAASYGPLRLVSQATIKRNSLCWIDVQFVANGVVVELPSDASGKLELKLPGLFDDDPITGAEEWTKSGTGAATVYRFGFTLTNEALDELFAANGDSSDDVSSIRLMMEISWLYVDRLRKTQTIDVIVENDVNRDDDEIPESPVVVYGKSSIRFFTGAGLPSNSVGVDLDLMINSDDWRVFQRLAGAYALKGTISGEGGGGGGPTVLSRFAGRSGNVGNSGFESIYSFVVPGGTLVADGDQIRAKFLLRVTYSATAFRGFSVSYDKPANGDYPLLETGGGIGSYDDYIFDNSTIIPAAVIELTITRVSSSAFVYCVELTVSPGDTWTSATPNKLVIVNDVTGDSAFASGDQTLDLSVNAYGSGAAADDIILMSATVEYHPAP